MRVALMQPYLFPYLGYFQMISSVDKFIFYDDVSFIKQGWINRNNILLNGKPFLFTVPLVNGSSFTLIKNTLIDQKKPWAEKFLKTLKQAYSKAPHFNVVSGIVEKVVLDTSVTSISDLAKRSILEIALYLQIPTEFIMETSRFTNQELSGESRVIDIAKQTEATQYHNAVGGRELYDRGTFLAHGIELKFVASRQVQYAQLNFPFVPNLSIIDVLMFNDSTQVRAILAEYDLV